MKKYYETIHSVSLQQNCLPFYVLVPNGLHRISIGNRHGSSKILILTSKPQHFEMSRSFFKIKSSPMEDLNGALNWKSIDLSKKHYFPMSKIITNMFLSDVPEGGTFRNRFGNKSSGPSLKAIERRRREKN